MLTFSDKYIERIATDRGVYNRGARLVGNVVSYEYLDDERVIHAVVEGTYPYEVEIVLNENGSVNNYYCECEAFRSYFGACKHIVAVMRYANGYSADYGQVSFFNNHTSNKKELLTNCNDTFLPLSELGFVFSKERRKVNLWVEQSLESGAFSGCPYLQLQFKIGFERPYNVKSISDLLDAIRNRKPLYFTKKFTFEPDTMYFEGMDKKILDFLLDIYVREKTEKVFYNSSSYSYDGWDSGSIRANAVNLIEDNLKKYFEIVKDSKIPINILNLQTVELKLHDDLEIHMELKEEHNSLVMEANYAHDEKIMPLTRDYELALNPYNLKIYRVPAHKAQILGKLHQIRLHKKKPVFRIDKKEQQQFVREFLKPYKDYFKVSIDPKIEDMIVEKELKTRIYFDAISNGISARIDFCYGEKIINPLEDAGQAGIDYYMRNYEQEGQVVDLLKSSGMFEKAGLMVLDDDEAIVGLISGSIEKLKDLAEIYYSEDFKKIQIKTVKNIQMGVRLNSESNLLEFDFMVDDFDDMELHRLFRSIKEKKKYYRLKDGSILKLEDNDLISTSKLLEDLSLDTRSFKGGVINIPSNRALFIDNYINDKKLKSFKTNDKFNTLVEDITHPKDMDFQLDDGLEKVLREYQKTGFKWLKTLSHYGFGGILADDMGLGKTLQVLAFIRDERKTHKEPCLVVAPTSLVYNWKSEASKFVPDLKVEVVHGTKAERNKVLSSGEERDIIVTSYGSLKRDIDRYREMEFSYVFVDEAQHIKNPNTLNANSVKSLKAKGCFAMTGTPIENSLTELWSIFDFIMPGYLMNHGNFVTKFEKPIVQNNDRESLNTLARFIKPFILRRLKNEVLQELPEKIESKVLADMTSEQRKLYAAYLKQAQGEIAIEIKEKGIERSKIKILALLTRLRQICCHPATFVEDYKGGSGKLETLLEIIHDSIDSGHRLLLFSQFTSMHSIIGKSLDKAGIGYFYLDGSTKAKDRIDMVDRFNKGEKSAFLISLKAGGTGLNLTGADMVIHYDPWWNPAVEDQATDRAYRIGQTKAVQVFKIITKGTIEERIFELQEKKRGLINNVIQPGENLLTRLGEEEIRELFQLTGD
ncbi:MAG: SNF2 helicase associated domain-containing protein [Bacillota bacterium]